MAKLLIVWCRAKSNTTAPAAQSCARLGPRVITGGDAFVPIDSRCRSTTESPGRREVPSHEVRGLYHRGGFRRRGGQRRADDRQPQAADRSGRGARLRGHVARGTPLRALRSRRPAEPNSARRGPGGADVQDSHRADGEHSAVVASHTARRRPRDSGQHDRRARGGRLRQRNLALRRARSFIPTRTPARTSRKQGAVQGDGRGGAGDMDQRVLLVSRVQLQLPRRRHRILPPEVPVEPRLAGRGPGDEAEGDAETPTRSRTRRCG